MNKESIITLDAPEPIGPYSQAIRSGNMLFISGQIALDPATNQLIEGDVSSETAQVMKNLSAILLAGGMDFSHVVKTTIFLTDMSLFTAVNEVYGKHFKSHPPARETVAVKGLPKGVNVEISMIAVLDPVVSPGT
ncbi:RidA family protein [Segetibacter sp. 3557_3]|uniref:RidA family protein n=1 Tax=Segetibacter sp. 3557_3 TaxID=2547429 RepID=UPI00105879C6|nr:RidA family protein [Segetibacter sp. 3557_3]TDH26247.1 RidA family protein [Segetibacter sp. 3557_3]